MRTASPALGEIAEALTTNVFTTTVLTSQSPSNVVPDRAEAELYGATLPGFTRDDLEAELRGRLGDGDYEVDLSEPEGGLSSRTDTPLFRAIEDFLHDRDPDARALPTLGYGYSDLNLFREHYGSRDRTHHRRLLNRLSLLLDVAACTVRI